jgi:hypothetical protein
MTLPAELLRTEQINLKLTTEELERLQRLAAHKALTPQAMLRMLLKEAADAFEAAHKALTPQAMLRMLLKEAADAFEASQKIAAPPRPRKGRKR